MTGLSQEQLDLLVERVTGLAGAAAPRRGRRCALDLRTAIVVTLVALRHNPSQALLAGLFGGSQPTVSRVVRRVGGLLGRVAGEDAAGLADVDQQERLPVDGTLLPTGNRAGQGGQGLYSGKRHRSGVNVHVVSDRWGKSVSVSSPVAGSMHDARSLGETRMGERLAGRPVLAG